MLLPLCMRAKRGIVRIEFPDLGVSDYNAPLLAAQFCTEKRESLDLWEQIARLLPPADIVDFQKMPESISGRRNPLLDLEGVRCMRMGSWGLDLPKTRSAYDLSLKPYARRDLRRWRRKLQEEGVIRFESAQSTCSADEIFETLIHQRGERFLRMGRPDIM